jgi:23S rRNA (guanosine2251-2'-O)-methyltransferase
VKPDHEGPFDVEAVHGVHAVRELLEARRRDVERLFVLRERAASVGRILRTARQAGVPVSYVDRPTLARKVGPRAVHQGIAAVVAPLPYADADELARRTIDDPAGLLVLVDRVEDAGNLGAILRTAGATGAVGVLLSADATVGLTAGVARASAGAAERVPVAREPRPSWRIGQLRAAGVRTVVLDPRGDVPWDRADLVGRLLVVAGGEARGARPGVRDACELRVSIPVARGVESLNVSVATAVLLFEAVRQRRRRPSLASSGPG